MADRRRTTRSQSATPAALPAVTSKQSLAYGAQGKSLLETQLAGDETSLENVLANAATTTTTTAATPRTTRSGRQTPVRQTQQPARSARRPAPPTIVEESDDSPAQQAADREPTLMDPERRYQQKAAERKAAKEAAEQLAAERLAAEQQVAELLDQNRQSLAPEESVADTIDQALPTRFRLMMDALLDYVPARMRNVDPQQVVNFLFNVVGFGLVLAFAFVLFAFLLWLWSAVIFSAASLLPWSGKSAEYAEEIVTRIKVLNGMSPYDKPPSFLEERWLRFKHDIMFEPLLPKDVLPDKQYQVNLLLQFRMDKLDERLSILEGTVGLHDETLERLHKVLPQYVAVEEMEGDLVIGEHFWQAFQQRMNSGSAAPLWDAFLEQNEHVMKEFTQKAAVQEIDDQYRQQKIITGEELVAELDKQYVRLKEEHASDLDNAEKAVLDKAKAVARAMVDDSALSQVSRLQSQALTSHLTLRNGLRELHSVNFLSKTLGAQVNHRHTSPSVRRPWKGVIYSTYTWMRGLTQHNNSPDLALEKWEDSSGAWCVPPSDDTGVAQLAVHMEHIIYPETFIVEHMPAAGTLNIASAPRHYDVWAETQSVAMAKDAESRISVYRRQDCGTSPGSKYVCIGVGSYDIHGTNWVQDIDLFAKLPDFQLPVQNIIFKVLNNWGGDLTCIYRIRMTGERFEVNQQ